MLTQIEVKKLFYYDRKSGKLIRKVDVNNFHGFKGSIVGSKHTGGYLTVCVEGKTRYVHRLVWLFHKGFLPEHGLDHINRSKTDNRIENLREASKQCNSRNSGNTKANKSGIKGVYWSKAANKWVAQIAVQKKTYYLGSFSDFTEAVCHRLAAEQCFDWSRCNSKSAARKYVDLTIRGKNG